jgi:hypothetical protein
MSSELNLWKRLQGETPKFFKRVFALSISLAAAATAVLAIPESIVVVPAILSKVAGYCIIAGVAAAAVSKTTVTTPTQPPSIAPNDEQQQNNK